MALSKVVNDVGIRQADRRVPAIGKDIPYACTG